ncbi:deoxynucleoside kinase, partial [Bacillus sp. SIMBA_069]
DIIDRVKERGRPMEQQTPIDYWKDLYGRYEDWIRSFHACPILRVNINEYDVVDDPASVENIIARVGEKIRIGRATRL